MPCFENIQLFLNVTRFKTLAIVFAKWTLATLPVKIVRYVILYEFQNNYRCMSAILSSPYKLRYSYISIMAKNGDYSQFILETELVIDQLTSKTIYT